jgi:hypothetical protein
VRFTDVEILESGFVSEPVIELPSAAAILAEVDLHRCLAVAEEVVGDADARRDVVIGRAVLRRKDRRRG